MSSRSTGHGLPTPAPACPAGPAAAIPDGLETSQEDLWGAVARLAPLAGLVLSVLKPMR